MAAGDSYSFGGGGSGGGNGGSGITGLDQGLIDAVSAAISGGQAEDAPATLGGFERNEGLKGLLGNVLGVDIGGILGEGGLLGGLQGIGGELAADFGSSLYDDISSRLSGGGGIQGNAGTPGAGEFGAAGTAGRGDAILAALANAGSGGGTGSQALDDIVDALTDAVGNKETDPILRAAQLEAKGQRRGIRAIEDELAVTQGRLDPFTETGAGALKSYQRGSTVGGVGNRLERIFEGGALDPLVAERLKIAQGQLGSVGLSRSGTALEEVSAIPTELGFALEQTIQDRKGDLVDLGFQGAQAQGAFGSVAGAGIADLLGGIGASKSAGILTREQMLAEQRSQDLASKSAKSAAKTSAIGDIAKFLLFSDPRLKTNVEKVGEVDGLGIYQWDWIPEAEGTTVEAFEPAGFMADEVERKYPEFVGEFCGWKVIDYPALIEHIKGKSRPEFS